MSELAPPALRMVDPHGFPSFPQKFMLALRMHGGGWPTNTTEEFIVRRQLNRQNFDFRPRQ